ncbi:phage holin family protein [Streptomyces sp. NPDC093094]|uniref:phage holin family protein n=1 Tax=Streptomyces sp. NPDC093094 TaxID=3366026 RepID=UPI003807BF64
MTAVSNTQPHSATTSPGRDRSDQDPVSELVQRASQQLAELVRGEMRLAQAEMKEKGRRYGKGGGLFGGAAHAFLLEPLPPCSSRRSATASSKKGAGPPRSLGHFPGRRRPVRAGACRVPAPPRSL